MTEIPDHIRVLSNGAWYDNNVKRIVKGPPLTSEQGLALRNRRTELAREKAAEGLRKAMLSQGLEVPSPEHAWGSVIEAQSLLAIDIDAAHASTQAAKLVGQASGMLSSDRTTIQDQRKQTVVIVGDGQASAYLAGLGIGQLAGDGERVASEATAPPDVGVEDDEGDDYAQLDE